MSDSLYAGGIALFVVDSHGTAEAMMISAEVSAAYDILTDDGMPGEKAAEMTLAAERAYRDGTIDRTPEQMARHIVKLRRILRQ